MITLGPYSDNTSNHHHHLLLLLLHARSPLFPLLPVLQPPPTSPPHSTAGDARGSCLRRRGRAAARVSLLAWQPTAPERDPRGSPAPGDLSPPPSAQSGVLPPWCLIPPPPRTRLVFLKGCAPSPCVAGDESGCRPPRAEPAADRNSIASPRPADDGSEHPHATLCPAHDGSELLSHRKPNQLCCFMVCGSGGAGKQYTVAPVSKWCGPASAEHVARYLIVHGSSGAGKHYTATPASKWCSSVLMSAQLTTAKGLVSTRLETIASCFHKMVIIQGVIWTM
ncbi:uncharacterized protein [Triticum aestivum]|uniref:uncharacterized protein n=1 Tax=Triticum aestivum TaxID=4565 RepID=UPI001D00B118|nr:uncharacterized protein LOC123139239 [Triticum aestivum]